MYCRKSFYWQLFTGMPSERFFTGNISQECHPKEFLLATFHRNAIRKVFYWQLFTGMSSERFFTGNFSQECLPKGFLLATFHRNVIRKVFYWQLFTGMPSERVFYWKNTTETPSRHMPVPSYCFCWAKYCFKWDIGC